MRKLVFIRCAGKYVKSVSARVAEPAQVVWTCSRAQAIDFENPEEADKVRKRIVFHYKTKEEIESVYVEETWSK